MEASFSVIIEEVVSCQSVVLEPLEPVCFGERSTAKNSKKYFSFCLLLQAIVLGQVSLTEG